MHNIDYMINAGIVSYFKTENPLIDGFILIFMATITSYLISRKHIIVDSSKKIFNKYFSKHFTYKVKLLAFESSSNRRYPTTQSSTAYNSVNFCIKNIMKCEIKEITENYDSFKRFNKLYENYDGEFELHDKIGYDITQSEIFKITDTIYGIYDIIIEDNDKKKENDTVTICGKKKYLTLMSNISLEEISIFIEKCIKIFDDHQEKVTSKGPFIFTYKGIKNNIPIYEEKYFKTLQTFENSIFDNKQELLDAISKFENKEYYKNHPQITRKIITLFHGEPGTGKTFSIRLIAHKLRRNIIVIGLNKIKSIDELNSVLFFNKINEHKIKPTDCVFVIEDLDAMTELLKNREYQKDTKNDTVSNFISLLTDKKNNDSDKNENNTDTIDNSKSCNSNTQNTLTMSDVLNTLDGIFKLDEYVIAFSTNHIDQLDPAFLRDQRITHKIKFTKCSKNVVKDIIEKWYKITLSEEELLLLKDNILTLANIATICDKYDNYKDTLQCIVKY